MIREENWAVAPERVRQFLRQQRDVTETDGVFCFGRCRITLEARTGELMGKWPQERTQIRLEGPQADTLEIYRRFFLQFLSAGG